MIRIKLILFLLISTFTAFASDGEGVKEGKKSVSVIKKYDLVSRTVYYLTHVPHKDENGKLLKLNLEMTVDVAGETVVDFAKRKNNPLLVTNGSQGIPGLKPGRVQSAGIQIVNRKVIQDIVYKPYAHTLGIKDDNELTYFKPGTRAQEMLDVGVNNALCGFVPLIVDFKPVSDEILTILKGVQEAHPRQIIAQFENLDLMFLSCGGRGFDGIGMSASDVIRILEKEKRPVKFAFMLDGGGSVTNVVRGNLITRKIDKKGKALRPRGNFLYIE